MTHFKKIKNAHGIPWHPMAQRVASHASGIACASVASVASGAAKRASGTKILSMVSAKACHGFSNGFFFGFFPDHWASKCIKMHQIYIENDIIQIIQIVFYLLFLIKDWGSSLWFFFPSTNSRYKRHCWKMVKTKYGFAMENMEKNVETHGFPPEFPSWPASYGLNLCSHRSAGNLAMNWPWALPLEFTTSRLDDWFKSYRKIIWNHGVFLQQWPQCRVFLRFFPQTNLLARRSFWFWQKLGHNKKIQKHIVCESYECFSARSSMQLRHSKSRLQGSRPIHPRQVLKDVKHAGVVQAPPTMSQAHRLWILWMPQCTLIHAIASFKKSLARLKAYSSVASLARRQTCRCCSGTTWHHQQCLKHIACESYECLSARSSMQLRHSKSRLQGSRPIHPRQVLKDVNHAGVVQAPPTMSQAHRLWILWMPQCTLINAIASFKKSLARLKAHSSAVSLARHQTCKCCSGTTTKSQAHRLWILWMPQCTLINAIASFKKSLARLKTYSSAASLERRQPCRCCSGTTNNVSSTSLVNLMNASVHAHQCNCVFQEVACKAQGLFIRGKSCKTSNMQVLFRHHMAPPTMSQAHRLWILWMPQCTLINAIASFKKSLARLKAYSSAASLERRQPCRCCSGTTNNVSSTSLVNLMNASVHAHQCNCVIQKVACKAQGLFIRGKSWKTSTMQVLFRHHQQCFKHIACESYECLSARSSMQLRHSKSRLQGSRPIHPRQVLKDVNHAGVVQAPPTMFQAHRLWILWMPQCTLINAIASFKKSLAGLNAYSSVASLARRQTCKFFRRDLIISFHVHGQSLYITMNHFFCSAWIIQKVAISVCWCWSTVTNFPRCLKVSSGWGSPTKIHARKSLQNQQPFGKNI